VGRFTAFVAACNYPGGAVDLLRQLGRLLEANPGFAPQQLLSRALTAFFTSHGLAFAADDAQRRAATRRQHLLDTVPAALRPATVESSISCSCATENASAESVHARSATSPSKQSCESCAISPSTSPAAAD
jgi:hypothetical protein